MNVEDFNVEIPAGDMLETIFNHQRELMLKYDPIEESIVGRKFPHADEFNIQDRQCQLRAKDFAWRITEELTEATLALEEENENHYLEELIDALHFSIELLIMCGFSYEDLCPYDVSVGGDIFLTVFYMSDSQEVDERKCTYSVIEKLGEAMNRLKLKPWKVTAMITDEEAFRKSMMEFFSCLIDLLKASGFTAKTAIQMYLNKNAVNNFRIKSKY